MIYDMQLISDMQKPQLKAVESVQLARPLPLPIPTPLPTNFSLQLATQHPLQTQTTSTYSNYLKHALYLAILVLLWRVLIIAKIKNHHKINYFRQIIMRFYQIDEYIVTIYTGCN